MFLIIELAVLGLMGTAMVILILGEVALAIERKRRWKGKQQ